MYAIPNIQVAEATVSWIKSLEDERNNYCAVCDLAAVTLSAEIDDMQRELSDYILGGCK